MLTPFDLNLRHTGATVAVGRCGSISGASSLIHMSQPALTQALAKLETLLGQRLFERQSSGASPTAAGALFVPRAERAIERLLDGGRKVRRSAQLAPIAHLDRAVTMSQLECLAAVERAGSYAMAAREIGLAQPSVHRAVKELEAVIGVPLLVKHGRAMRPTAAGVRLVSAIRLMVVELQAALDELAALQPRGGGTVRIGALPLPRAGLLPEALVQFAAKHPYTRVTIIEGPYAELLGALRGGEIDLIVGALRLPAPTHDIHQRTLFEDELHVVARAGHPVSVHTDPTPEMLTAYPWVVGPEGSPMRASWEAMFEQTHQPTMRLECSSILTARGLLMGGDWLALMSKDQFRFEQQARMLTAIGKPLTGSRRKIGVTTRVDWLPTAEQAALIAALTDAGQRRVRQVAA